MNTNEYKQYKADNICPHNTSPLQLKALCKRCRLMESLDINVYQMPNYLGNDWAARIGCTIADGFETRQQAEDWAVKKGGK